MTRTEILCLNLVRDTETQSELTPIQMLQSSVDLEIWQVKSIYGALANKLKLEKQRLIVQLVLNGLLTVLTL